MIEGIVIIIVGTLAMIAAPAHEFLTSRRQILRPIMIGTILRQASPTPAASADLTARVEQADRAMEDDDLVRGVRALTETYRRA